MAKSGAKILFGLIFFVVLVAGLAGGGAWYLTEHRVDGYRATALLMVGPGPVAPPAPALSEAPAGLIRDALGMDAPPNPGLLAAPDYAELFMSDSMAQAVQERLAKEGSASSMTISRVKAAMNAESAVALQTRDRVEYQRLLKLHFTAPDPALAAQGANSWAQECEKAAHRLVMEQYEERALALRTRLEQLQAELEAARTEQAALRQESPLEPLELAVKSSSEAVEDLKHTVRTAQADAARGDASLKALKAYVSKAPPAVVLELSMAEATAEAETAGARAEGEFLATQLAEAEAAASAARVRWAEALLNHERVEETIDLLAPEVAALARPAMAGDPSPPVQQAAQAIAPEKPAGPHRYVIVAGTAILGAIAGMIVYFGLLTLRVYARELDRG